MFIVFVPGQLTVEELMKRRVESGLLVPRKYYLFGSPIQQSLSPAMHNGAFNALLLPHNYSINEKTEVSLFACAVLIAFQFLLHRVRYPIMQTS